MQSQDPRLATALCALQDQSVSISLLSAVAHEGQMFRLFSKTIRIIDNFTNYRQIIPLQEMFYYYLSRIFLFEAYFWRESRHMRAQIERQKAYDRII